MNYDVVIIGTGPAGESAAMNATKHGKTAVVIEQHSLVGGACAHKGTIPSKALRENVRQAMRYSSNPLFQKIDSQQSIDFQQLLEAAAKITREQVSSRTRNYTKNAIPIIHGKATFNDPNTLEVVSPDGSREIIHGKRIIIATGSSPWRPDDIDFSDERIRDSDTILSLTTTPKKIIIYGAGVIGCEYASIFSGLGLKVDLINTRDRLLEFLDDEISDALSYHLRTQGVMVRHREAYKAVESHDKGVTLHLQSGKKIHADLFLWCNGRAGNTEGLGLEKLGIETDHRQQITVNKRYQTSIPHIYAVGDVIGWPSLASASFDQGRAAAAAARGKEQSRFVDDFATGIYTIPEISSVGKTERELTDEQIPYEVGRALFHDIARAQIRGETVGMLKLLFHTETLEILGVHCFGADATEIIHIGQAIMKQQGQGNNIHYFVTTTFNYPTMAEAYRVAALNGINRIYQQR